MSSRHHARRRRVYGRRQHDLRERGDRGVAARHEHDWSLGPTEPSRQEPHPPAPREHSRVIETEAADFMDVVARRPARHESVSWAERGR